MIDLFEMIPDNQTNFLYLADTLSKYYPNFYKAFEKALKLSNISFDLLPATKDVWAVDYMPIQTDVDRFVQFIYRPSYLKTKSDLASISDTTGICREIGIRPIKSGILLDGGNVIRCADKVIITERVFAENPAVEQHEVMKELRKLFEVDKLYTVPEYPDDFTGHADGLLRFLDEHTVLINDFIEEKEFSIAFEKVVKKAGLDFIKIPYNPYGNRNMIQANGIYINYLQMKGIVFIPIFGIREDEAAVKRFEQLFKGQAVVPVNANGIADKGGVLNCITWNIMK